MAVRWYCSLPLSTAQVVRLLAERHVDVSARTVLNWCKRLARSWLSHSVGIDGGWGEHDLSTKYSVFGASRVATYISPLISMGKSSMCSCGTNGIGPVQKSFFVKP